MMVYAATDGGITVKIRTALRLTCRSHTTSPKGMCRSPAAPIGANSGARPSTAVPAGDEERSVWVLLVVVLCDPG